MLQAIRFLLPFSYLWASRLRSGASWASMLGYDWLPQVLLIWWLTDFGPLNALTSFALAYLAFISLYELGYLTNDTLSVRFEKNPRHRIPGFAPPLPLIALWMLSRLAAFIGLTHVLGLQGDWTWWAFHGLLALVFVLHNLLRLDEVRVGTFAGLAFGRFFGPLVPWLSMSAVQLLMFPVVVNYVLFRLLGYLDAKDLLQMPGRRSSTFRIGFYLVLLPLNAMASVMLGSWLPLVAGVWYLAFWTGLMGAKRIVRAREHPIAARGGG